MADVMTTPTESSSTETSSPQFFPDDAYAVQVPPMDDYNKEMLSNARPPAWVNPTPEEMYNLVVIGAGTAGIISALGAAGLGAKVALVEKYLVGGDCLYAGCVPSKAIIRSAHVVGEIRRGHQLGVHVDEQAVSINFDEVMQRMRRIRAEISYDDSVARFRSEGVDVFLGAASFSDPNTIEVNDGTSIYTLPFKKAVICTGSNPRELDIPGLYEAGYLTNETLFQLTEQPRRLAILGSGPIGSEMAQTFARLGTEVTILERMGQILTKEDPDAAQVVQNEMVKDGVTLRFNVGIKSVEKTETGKVIHFIEEGEMRSCEVDEILVSAGRVPGIEGLNLEAAGVEYTERAVTTDDTLQTTNPDVYASGDVAQKYQFTHMADATSRIVLRNALFPGPKQKLGDLIVPWCTYTDPQIAHVGLYEKDAQAKGIKIETFVKHFDDVDRPRTDGETEGFVKIHVKKGTDKIVGATIVASEAGEMINEITTAMVGGMGLKTLATVIHPYPVQAEAIKKIADAYNRTRLTPIVKWAFQMWMRWSRR